LIPISNGINMALINGLLLIHPILVFFTYIYCAYLYHLYLIKKKLIILFINNLFYHINIIAIISWFSLILGSLWAQQELNWGGWWNWDFVEIILLIFFLHILFIYHLNFLKNYNLINLFLKKFLWFIFLFIYLIRINITNSIHNFAYINFSSNYYLLLIYLFYIFCYLKFINIYNNFIKYWIIEWNIFLLFLKNLNNIFLIFIYINILCYNNNIFLIDLTKYIKYLFIYLFMYLFIYLFLKNYFICIYLYMNILSYW
jgi:cytochrome c biogenesis factor